MNDLVKRLRNGKSLTFAHFTMYEAADEIERMTSELDTSAGLKCPNCDDVGWYPNQISDDDWEQVQCEFCYTIKDSVFNRTQNK